MNRENYNAIDVVKLICAVLVVGIHTGPFLSVNETLNYFFVQILGRVAVPFFFVASAFFFFSKLDYSIGMTAKDNLNFLKKYVLRILKLYGVWTLIYLTILIYQWSTGGFNASTVVRFLRDLVFTGSYYHLWFLPAMAFSMVLVYFMVAKLKTLRILEIALALYILGMLVNVYGEVFANVPGINSVIKAYLSVFETTRNGLFFGVIFSFIGSYIATHRLNMEFKSLLTRTLISFGLLFIEGFFIKGLNLDTPLTSMYLMLIPFIFYFFLLLLKVNLKDSERFATFRACSTMVYLSHVYFAVLLSALPFEYNSIVYFVLVLILAVDFSYIVYILAKKPKYKFLRILY